MASERKWKKVADMDAKERKEYADIYRREFVKAVAGYARRRRLSPYTAIERLMAWHRD